MHNIGCLSLETGPLKHSLRTEALMWKAQYTSNLHKEAQRQLYMILETMTNMEQRLEVEIVTLDDARKMMATLRVCARV